MLIYRAKLPNDKSYIGCTSRSLSERQRNHKNKALKKNSQLPFHRAIRFYGFDSIVWEILFETEDHKTLLAKEIELISLYQTKGIKGYNVTFGGEGTLGFKYHLGKKQSEATLAKRREITPGKKVFVIDCKNKICTEYKSIAAAARDNDIPYAQAKTAFNKKYSYYQYKLVSAYDINDPKLFQILPSSNAIAFKITNGQEIKEVLSINELRKFLNISERRARNLYYKNEEILGWRKYV